MPIHTIVIEVATQNPNHHRLAVPATVQTKNLRAPRLPPLHLGQNRNRPIRADIVAAPPEVVPQAAISAAAHMPLRVAFPRAHQYPLDRYHSLTIHVAAAGTPALTAKAAPLTAMTAVAHK